MIMAFLKYQFAGLWPLLWHFGLGGVIVIGCGVLYAFTPAPLATLFPNIRKTLLWVASITVAIMISTAIGVSLGEKRIQAQWSAALIAEVDAGEADRAAAVAAVPADTTDRSVFRDDPFNRDARGTLGTEPKSKVRWLAPHHLFGKR